MNRRELFVSFLSPSNRHFLHPNCQTPVEFDTLDSSFVRASLDHLVGAGEQSGRDGEAERLSGEQIDDEIEFGRLLDWDVGRLGPTQNLVDITSRAPVQV